jgi:hypothetical protein
MRHYRKLLADEFMPRAGSQRRLSHALDDRQLMLRLGMIHESTTESIITYVLRRPDVAAIYLGLREILYSTDGKDRASHPDKLLLYQKLVATNAGVELKGATVPHTSLNGNMSSYLSKEGKLALRLPPSDIEAFLTKYKSKLCEAYGVVQKEYVEVPDTLLSKTEELKVYFEASVEYVGALKPKATKKKKQR